MLKNEEKSLSNDVLLENTSVWKEKKNNESPPLRMWKNLNFLYWNLDWDAHQPVVGQGLCIPDIL